MRILSTIVCAAVITVNVSSTSRSPSQSNDRISAGPSANTTTVAFMEEMIQSFATKKQFMGAVLVAREDDILLNKGYGFANLEWSIHNSPNTKFQLGSLTKQFTAASILLLQERGKLKVTDLVKKYVPDAPAAWDGITIFHLLTHTSGIPDYADFPDESSLEPFATTPEKLVARFRDKPLQFEPGEKFNYSSSGYALLGFLIEKISREKYGQFVDENIFKPLGMADSGYASDSAVIRNRASGYTPGPSGLADARVVNMSVPFAAGGLYSTTEDLLRWEQGIMGGKLLSSASLKEMLTPFKNNYAFGLFVATENGYRMIDHGGRLAGFDTALIYYPDDKLTVVVLGNTDADIAPEIAVDLGTVAHGGSVTTSR